MFQPLELKSKRRDREIVPTNKGIKLMRQLNARMLFVCFAALLFVFACADTSKKEAEEAAPAQTAEATVEEVTLTVTGMT
jgi:hypothetical protein